MVNSIKPKMNFYSINLKIIKVKMKVIIREIVEKLLSRTKAAFKTTRNLEQPFKRKNMLIQKRSKSTFSTTQLALILGGAGFLGSPVWAAEVIGFSSEAAKNAGPQYGGSITFLDGYGAAFPPTAWNKGEGSQWTTGIYHEPMYETLLHADIEKFGPRGSGTTGFYHSQGFPLDFLRGRLAESWSLPDANTIIFTLRRGIMWSGKPGVMESRELTARI